MSPCDHDNLVSVSTANQGRLFTHIYPYAAPGLSAYSEGGQGRSRRPPYRYSVTVIWELHLSTVKQNHHLKAADSRGAVQASPARQIPYPPTPY
jgi:hypothetical protein